MWRRAVSVLQVKDWKILEFFNADFTCFFCLPTSSNRRQELSGRFSAPKAQATLRKSSPLSTLPHGEVLLLSPETDLSTRSTTDSWPALTGRRPSASRSE